MKMMFLNTCWGRTGNAFWNYLEEESKGVEVFCFMETGDKFDTKCKEILTDYACVSTNKKVINEVDHSISVYVKKEIEILESESILKEDEYVGAALFTKIKSANKIINIASVHGVAIPGNKLDNPKRIEQSEKIIEYMAKVDGGKIIGGDFNLDKNTESVKMFEKSGYRNLIEEFKIDMTRNHLIWDVFPENKQFWADFLFVSSKIEIKSFEVPKNEVSDHLPLILEIEN